MSAADLSDGLGLPEPAAWGPFLDVEASNGDGHLLEIITRPYGERRVLARQRHAPPLATTLLAS